LLGQWIIDHDRGKFARPLGELLRLFQQAGLRIEQNRPLMLGPIRTEVVICRPAGRAASETEPLTPSPRMANRR